MSIKTAAKSNVLRVTDNSFAAFRSRVTAIKPETKQFHGRWGLKGGRPLGDVFKEAVDKALATTEADLDTLADLEQAARSQEQGGGGDTNARRQLHKIRTQTTMNWVLATATFIPAVAEIIILEEDETPYVENRSFNETLVARKAPGGKIRAMRVDSSDILQNQKVPLFMLASNPVYYPIFDLYQGSKIKDSAVATFDLALDWALGLDKAAKDFAASAGLFGAFALGGAKKGRTYATHSYVNPANLPIRNDLNVKATGTIIDIAVQACAFCAGYGKNAFKDGELYPTGVIRVPSGDIYGFLKQIQNISVLGQVANLGNEIIQKGVNSFFFNGITWSLEGDNTLAPGTCYPVYSKKAMTVYLKPAGDRIITKPAGEEDASGNEMEERSMAKPVGFVINKSDMRNICSISYTGTDLVTERTAP